MQQDLLADMTKQAAWEHIKTHYPDVAKIIRQIKSCGMTLEMPRVYREDNK